MRRIRAGLLFVVMLMSAMAPAARSLDLPTTRPVVRTGPFILGADVTWILEDEAAGATYFDHGVQKDPFDILKAHGFNFVRLRVFVDPKAPRGYATRRDQAFGDVDHLLVMARRAKAHDMGILVDFFYSDSWADPEHQPKPAAWEKLGSEELERAVAGFTRDVLAKLKAQGTPAQMVQIGNEITHGLLWPDGRVISQISSGNPDTDARMKASGLTGLGNYDQLARFLKAAIAEVRAADPNIKIVLHNHLGRSTARVQEWMDQLIARGVDFDVVGLSCYAQSTDGDWERTFNDIVRKHPQYGVIAVEYSARKRDLNDLVFALPDRHGLGTFIWEPTRHREALFDQNGVNAGGGQASNFVGPDATQPATAPATRPRINRGGRYDTNVLIDLYPQMAKDYADR